MTITCSNPPPPQDRGNTTCSKHYPTIIGGGGLSPLSGMTDRLAVIHLPTSTESDTSLWNHTTLKGSVKGKGTGDRPR